jgi:uncharacterized protein (DUF1778 family)
VAEHIQNLKIFLVEHKLATTEQIAKYTLKFNITTERAAAYIERFLFPPHDRKRLRAYLTNEVRVMRPALLSLPVVQQAAASERKDLDDFVQLQITDQHIDGIARILEEIISVLRH